MFDRRHLLISFWESICEMLPPQLRYGFARCGCVDIAFDQWSMPGSAWAFLRWIMKVGSLSRTQRYLSRNKGRLYICLIVLSWCILWLCMRVLRCLNEWISVKHYMLLISPSSPFTRRYCSTPSSSLALEGCLYSFLLSLKEILEAHKLLSCCFCGNNWHPQRPSEWCSAGSDGRCQRQRSQVHFVFVTWRAEIGPGPICWVGKSPNSMREII